MSVLNSQPLPPGVTRVEEGDDPQYNHVFVTGTWQGVARLHQRLIAIDGPPRRIRIRLSHIDASMQTIRHLGFDPYAPGLGANEMTGPTVTARLLKAVRQGVLRQIADITVTPLEDQSAIISTLRPAGTPAAHIPSVSYGPIGAGIMPSLPRGGSGMCLTVKPHIVWPSRIMVVTDIALPGRGEVGANSWAGDNQPTLLTSIMTVQPVYKDFRTRRLKTDGAVRLLLGTPDIIQSSDGRPARRPEPLRYHVRLPH